MFDCISLTLLGPSDRLQAHSWASNSSPCSSVYSRASSTFAPLRGNPYLANPVHKRFHSWASLGRRPLLRVDDLFLSSLHPSRKTRGLLQTCPAGVQNVTLLGFAHVGDSRMRSHKGTFLCEAAAALMSCLLYRQTAMRSAVWTQQIHRTTKR